MLLVMNDQAYMAEAIRLAYKGLYTVRKNPRVGCVLVKDGEIIGKGFHKAAGEAHAEIEALNSTSENPANATAYVSLEPCAHEGKTPACTDALISAKVSRVVCAMQDPNPIVNGKGLQTLKDANIRVDCNTLAAEAANLNKGFIKRVVSNKPFVTVKSAISLDGKTALSTGESKWITGKEARNDVQKLRARSCAILTGIETIINDDPRLTVRLTKQELNCKSNVQQPIRIILDTKLRIAETANVLNQAGDNIIFTASQDKNKINQLTNNNVQVISCKNSDKGIDVAFVLEELAKREINEVLVEAGNTLVGNLLKNQHVDEWIVYIAPQIIGNSEYNLAKINPIYKMNECLNLEIKSINKIGSDIKLIAKPKI